MDIFKWIAFIVFVVMAAEVWKYQIKMKHQTASKNKDFADQSDRIDALEERIKTLEKIVTDPSETLKRSIDELR